MCLFYAMIGGFKNLETFLSVPLGLPAWSTKGLQVLNPLDHPQPIKLKPICCFFFINKLDSFTLPGDMHHHKVRVGTPKPKPHANHHFHRSHPKKKTTPNNRAEPFAAEPRCSNPLGSHDLQNVGGLSGSFQKGHKAQPFI